MRLDRPRPARGATATHSTSNRWHVDLSGGPPVEPRSLREAYVFVLGLASAAQVGRV